MKHTEHAIARVEFETVLERRERVRSVQDRISRFANGVLQDVLTEGLSRFDESRRTSVFRRVELDVGEISLEHLERDLEERITRQLRAWALRKAPRPHSDESGVRALPGSRSAPEAGFVPGSESRQRDKDESPLWLPPEDAGGYVLDIPGEIPGDLTGSRDGPNRHPDQQVEDEHRWLMTLRDRSALRARQVAKLAPQQRTAILEAWMPEHCAAVIEFATLLSRLHIEHSLVLASGATFEGQLWRCILDEAADYRPASFSLGAFLRRVVARLVRYHSLPFGDMAQQIAAAWKRRPEFSEPSHAWFPILEEFSTFEESDRQDRRGELATTFPPAALRSESREAATAFSAPESWVQLECSEPGSLGNLARFLEWGVLPWSGPSATGETVESELLSSLASDADQVCAMVRSLGEMATVRKRIAVQFSETVVQRLIGELDPVNATWMLLCTKQLRLLHRQKPLIAIEDRTFGELLSELTLEYLSERHWHALDEVSFLRFLLLRLAYRQKVGYEVLLADLALRRSPDSNQSHPAGEIDPQSRLSATIATLLDTDLLGIRNRLAHAPRFAVRAEFRHLYCDLDVLAYWIRWRKLPEWSADDHPRDVLESLEPLFELLPPDCSPDCVAEAGIGHDRSGSKETPREFGQQAAEDITPAIQIERWLLFGLWPAKVETPEDSALERWLEEQTDAGWLQALERCGAQDQAISRMARLSAEFVLRIAGLLSGPNAESVHDFLRAVRAIGQPLGGSFPPPWEKYVNRYALARLLEEAPSERRSSAFPHHLARATLLALSLSLQIPYERMLSLLRQECDGSSSLEGLCVSLADELESGQKSMASTVELDSSTTEIDGSEIESAGIYGVGPHRVQPDGAYIDQAERSGSEIVRIYLLSGRLPVRAAGLSFAACQRIARLLTDSELASIAEACAGGERQAEEILRRAERLLAPDRFVRLKQLSSSRDRAQLEEQAAGGPRRRDRQTGRAEGRPQLEARQADGRPRFERRADPELETALGARNPETNSSPMGRDGFSVERERLLGGLDAFAFFLRKGVIPWWGEQTLSGSCSEWLEPLFKEAPEDLLSTLRSAASSPCTIERLLRYVPRDSIATIIRHAESGFGGMVVQYLHAGEELASDAGLTGAQRSSAAAAHWRSALQLFLDTDQPRRSFAGTLEYLADRVSQQLGMTTSRYWESLARVAQLRTGEESGKAELAGIILQLGKIEVPSEIQDGSGRDGLPAHVGRPASQPTRTTEQPAATLRDGSDESQAPSLRRLDREDRAGEEVFIPAANDLDRERGAAPLLQASSMVPARTTAGENGLPNRESVSIASGADALTSALLQLPPVTMDGNRLPPDPTPHAIGSVPEDAKELATASGPLHHSPGPKTSEARSLPVAKTLDAPRRAAHQDESSFEPVIDSGAAPTKMNPRPVDESSAGAIEIQDRIQDRVRDPVQDQVQDRPGAVADMAEEQATFVPDPSTPAGRLEYLLRFGVLPESATADSLDKFMCSLVEGIGRNPEQYRKLIERAARGAMERRRMVKNFSAEALEAVWKLLLPTEHAVARLCMEELAEAACSASTASRREEFHHICGEELIEASIPAYGNAWEVATYLRRALLRLSEDHGLATAETVRDLRSRFSRQPEPLRTRLNKALEQAERETARIPIWHRPPVPARSVLPFPTAPRLLQRLQKLASQLPAGEPFYIANAGAIILWPFLGRYFQTLGLMEKNAFHDEAARSRAIYLVQYLVTGVAEAPEPALLLNKILCGAQPEQPLDPPPTVSEEEAALSTQMLQGVIANWGKLGNTSIEGLRESFLIREGRLVRKESDNSWALTVSQKAFDVLLDALPWRLSMIRLPWMQTLLNVKWR
jgi:hypothetical protein